MPRIPITGPLLADLLTAARAHGARIIDVAVVVETPTRSCCCTKATATTSAPTAGTCPLQRHGLPGPGPVRLADPGRPRSPHAH